MGKMWMDLSLSPFSFLLCFFIFPDIFFFSSFHRFKNSVNPLSVSFIQFNLFFLLNSNLILLIFLSPNAFPVSFFLFLHIFFYNRFAKFVKIPGKFFLFGSFFSDFSKFFIRLKF